MSNSVPPVPDTQFSEIQARDYIIKEYLEKIRSKLQELEYIIGTIEARITALGLVFIMKLYIFSLLILIWVIV